MRKGLPHVSTDAGPFPFGDGDCFMNDPTALNHSVTTRSSSRRHDGLEVAGPGDVPVRRQAAVRKE